MNSCNVFLENYAGCIENEELWHLLYLADPNKDVINNYIKNAKIIVAKMSQKIVGVAVLTNIKNLFELKNIAVLSDYQGKGIAKKLIKEVKLVAKNKGANEIWVSTGNSSLNQLALYQKTGFRIVGVTPGYFDNYPEPIYENGIRCRDKINLSLLLR